MRKIFIPAGVGAALGLLFCGALNNYSQREVSRPLPPTHSEQDNVGPTLGLILSENAVLEAKLAAARSTTKMPEKDAVAVRERTQWPPISMADLSHLTSNSATVSLALGYFKANRYQKYSPIISILKLTSGQKLSLENLLLERAASSYDMAELAMDGGDMRKIKKEADEKYLAGLTEIIGSEYAEFVEKLSRLGNEWGEIRQLNESMLLHSARLDFHQMRSVLADWPNFSVQKHNGKTDAEFAVEFDGAYRSMLQNASSYLEPFQVKLLEKFLKSQLILKKNHLATVRAISAKNLAPKPTP